MLSDTAAADWFRHIVRGNEDAARVCALVFDVWNHYDHVIDRDVSGEALDAAMHDAMWKLFIDLPANAFYRRHSAELSVSLANAISTWRASATLERSSDRRALEMAHVMRWIPAEFFLHVARIAAGREWAESVAPEFWLAVSEGHTLDAFLEERGAKKWDG